MRLLLFVILFLSCFSAVGQVANERSISVALSNDSIISLNKRSRELLDRAPMEAFVLVKRALEAAEQNNFRHGKADAMSVLGYYYKDQANYGAALEYFSTIKKGLQQCRPFY